MNNVTFEAALAVKLGPGSFNKPSLSTCAKLLQRNSYLGMRPTAIQNITPAITEPQIHRAARGFTMLVSAGSSDMALLQSYIPNSKASDSGRPSSDALSVLSDWGSLGQAASSYSRPCPWIARFSPRSALSRRMMGSGERDELLPVSRTRG